MEQIPQSTNPPLIEADREQPLPRKPSGVASQQGFGNPAAHFKGRQYEIYSNRATATVSAKVEGTFIVVRKRRYYGNNGQAAVRDITGKLVSKFRPAAINSPENMVNEAQCGGLWREIFDVPEDVKPYRNHKHFNDPANGFCKIFLSKEITEGWICEGYHDGAGTRFTVCYNEQGIVEGAIIGADILDYNKDDELGHYSMEQEWAF